MGQRCTGTSYERFFNEETGQWEHLRDAEGNEVTKPCKSWAMRGSDPPRCISHAGGEDLRRRGLKQGRKITREVRASLGDLITLFDVPDANPMDELLELVRYTGAVCRSFVFLVGGLPIEPTIEWEDGIPRADPGVWGLDHTGDQAPHVVVSLYGQWVDRHVKACKAALDAGIDERLVRNAEATSGRFLEAFRRAVSRVQLTDAQKVELSKGLGQEIRALMAQQGRVIDIPDAESLEAG